MFTSKLSQILRSADRHHGGRVFKKRQIFNPAIRHFAVLMMILFSGCEQSLLLTKDELSNISSEGDKSRIVYYKSEVTVDQNGKMLITDHSVLRVGSNVKNINEYFVVFDGSIQRLLVFQARIQHANGSNKKYSAGDLMTFSLSGASQISDAHLRALSISEEIMPGDLIEKVEVHEQTLPELGYSFSMSSMRMRAENISLIITVLLDRRLQYKVINDTISPSVDITKEKMNRYTFHWTTFSPSEIFNSFQKLDRDPGVLAAFISDTASTAELWKRFGDWYLSLVERQTTPTEQIRSLSQNITAGKTDAKAKMEAIFNYCKTNIRYEQVYLSRGEFIPNPASVILERKYGDCKDYSTVIYAMAKSIGIDADLTLCYRGRGHDILEDIAVSQFNHMIVHYAENGKDYWYDGTNRTGEAGITTIDLLNAEALVLKKGNSRIANILESPLNAIFVTGNLNVRSSSLAGTVTFDLQSQYATDFYFYQLYLNREKMKEFIISWLHHNMNSQMSLASLQWKTDSGRFIISAECEMPNAVTHITPFLYTGTNKIFPQLLTENEIPENEKEIYFYPGYDKIFINLNIMNAQTEERINKVCVQADFNVTPGPFTTGDQQRNFLLQYRTARTNFQKPIKFTITDEP